MKFIVSNDENELDVTNASEDLLKSKDSLFRLEPNQLVEIQDKMKSIRDNFDVVKKQAQWNAENSIAMLDGKPMKEQELKDVKELDKVEIIELGTDWAIDEFLFKTGEDVILPNTCNSIEVVTKEIAESNDMDWITGTPEISLEERKTYKVGEILSDYTKLDNKYYFKFM